VEQAPRRIPPARSAQVIACSLSWVIACSLGDRAENCVFALIELGIDES